MTKPLGIISGLGDLPVSIAQNCIDSGRDVFVVRLKGFIEPQLEAFPGDVVGLGELGKLFSLLSGAGCEEVTFAGIVKRPNFKDLKLDFTGAKLLPKVLSAARKGDDALLSLMVKEFERNGFTVIGSGEANQSLLMSEGCLTVRQPTENDFSDIQKGAHIAGEMGRLDIGQGCVVVNGLVLTVEAQEGTDEMLVRCANLPEELRGSQANPQGVLVKRPKPGQERRIDLPTAGMSTIENAAASGLAGVALEAGGALLLDREAVIARANELGLFVFGFSPDIEL
ncbi:MAG: LpxI family protein [Hyphomonas sp.]